MRTLSPCGLERTDVSGDGVGGREEEEGDIPGHNKVINIYAAVMRLI